MACPIRVIKIGGSLLDKAGLPEAIERWAADVESQVPALNVWLVGGGAAVDVIRDLDAQHRLPPELTHWASIRMMDINARLLGLHFLDWPKVDRLAEIVSHRSQPANDEDLVLATGQATNLLIQPSSIIRELESLAVGTDITLPASWEVTSDSIAAWLGIKLNAIEVVLLKSCNVPNVDLKQLQSLGVIDGFVGESPFDFDKLTLRCERLI